MIIPFMCEILINGGRRGCKVVLKPITGKLLGIET